MITALFVLLAINNYFSITTNNHKNYLQGNREKHSFLKQVTR